MSEIASKNNKQKRIPIPQLHKLTQSLTDTELSILKLLDNFHYAYGSQIQRLYFTDGTPLAMTRARNRLLTKLTNEQLLYRYPRKPLRGSRHGSTEHIYTLAHAGQTAMNEVRDSERPYRNIERTTSHFEHALTVTELHVRMVELDRKGSIKLITSLGEPACHRHFGVHKICKPDWFTKFRIQRGSQRFEMQFFVEVEKSRQGEPSTIAKIHTYQDFMQSLNPDKDIMPAVLFITFTTIHLQHLTQLLRRNTPDDGDVFSATLIDNAIPTLLGEKI